MLPEIEEYFKHQEDSHEYYEELDRLQTSYPLPRWRREMSPEERQEYYTAERAREIAFLDFKQEYREKSYEYRDALKNHSDPMIKWLFSDPVLERNFRSYRDTVARHLPMSREEIDNFGDEQGWCSDYGRMLDRAREANVLPEPVEPIADVNELVRDLRRSLGGAESHIRRRVLQHLPHIIASYEERKAAREAAEAAEKVSLVKAAKDTPMGGTIPAGPNRQRQERQQVRDDEVLRHQIRDHMGRFAALVNPA